MKKISTKIVAISLINSLFVVAINVSASLFNNLGSTASATATTASSTTAAVSATTAAAAPQMGGGIALPTSVMVGLVISVVLGVFMSYLCGRIISKPIIKVTDITKKTAELDLVEDKKFDDLLRYKDESGAMAKALLSTRKSLKDMVIKLQNVSSTIAVHSNSLTSITDDNVKTLTQVTETISELANGNNSQVLTVNEMNETMSEVVRLIDTITEETSRGADNAVKSLDFIAAGNKAVDVQAGKMDESITISLDANESIQDLSSMIEQVAGIINVITSISNQTNLLALNAAIEAARAGESGKGFAVVAEEIRKLAEESSNAAQKITDIINKTNEKTDLAVSSIKKAGLLVNEQKDALLITQDVFKKIEKSYDELVNGFNQSASSMKVINEKSRNIFLQTQNVSSVAEEFAASTEEISASSQQQLASTEMIAQASKDLLSLSVELSTEINRFKVS